MKHITGHKTEYDFVGHLTNSLCRDVEYFLEVNHPEQIRSSDLNHYVIKNTTIESYAGYATKEILLRRGTEYCIVVYNKAYSKKKGAQMPPDTQVVVAIPRQARFLTAEQEE